MTDARRPITGIRLAQAAGFALLATCLAPIGAPAAAAQEMADPAPQELVTLDYRDADLSNVLRSLSYTYNLNLVTSSDVKGKVTVSLKNVTIDEALQAILSANDLAFARRGNIVYINAAEAQPDAVISEVVRLKYLKAPDAQNLVRKLLSDKGDIRIDEVSNAVVLTDFPKQIEQVKSLLQQIDEAPQQVLIEARIVDITSSDLHNIGVTWGADYAPAGQTKGLFDRSTQFQEQLEGTVRVPGTSSTLSSGQFTLDTLTLKGISVTATLDALIQDRKANLLASPSIAVLNNQEARIVIGEKVPFKERTQTTTGTTETTKFIDVGTTLRVTPTINTDGYITMYIHPEVSSVASLLDAGPRITTREADTTVRIRAGETIVIAGLIKQEDNRTMSEVPWLGRVPILRHLFSSRSKDQTQTELAVFITPSIIRSREELAKLGKDIVQREVAFVNVPMAGRLGLISTLFETADRLERGEGLESRRKPEWQRMQQAMRLYESIAYDFPESPKAPVALLRAATIQLEQFDRSDEAARHLRRLIEQYPRSDLVPSAKRLLEQAEARMPAEPAPGPGASAAPYPAAAAAPETDPARLELMDSAIDRLGSGEAPEKDAEFTPPPKPVWVPPDEVSPEQSSKNQSMQKRYEQSLPAQ
ncbi:MAG TPA: secretin N-terminal domain-containing protein [bacterium]